MFEQYFSSSTPPSRVRFVSHNLLSSVATANWLKPRLPHATPIELVSSIESAAPADSLNALVVLDLDYLELRAREVAQFAEMARHQDPVVGISAIEGNQFVEEFSRLAPAIPVYRIDQRSSEA